MKNNEFHSQDVINQNQAADETTPTKITPTVKGQGRQNGFTLQDFIFWMIVASIAFLAILSLYNVANGMIKVSTTSSDVVQMKAAVVDWQGAKTDVAGVSISELCKDGNGNKGATWCGQNKDGKKANPYGGDYSIAVATNASRVDISMTNVDANNLNRQATKLAPVSADRCPSMPCTSVTASGTTIKVTM
ncbi:hypothetical protein [Shewanella sp. M-Br]|uniref:hypothetical protein n=1 Tax=Shewanella sp. M-Br TaxID=2495595 RepID=UPI00294A1051|nr:hypothetical protein SMBr_28060 [Shewanella sp. M-Br]